MYQLRCSVPLVLNRSSQHLHTSFKLLNKQNDFEHRYLNIEYYSEYLKEPTNNLVLQTF